MQSRGHSEGTDINGRITLKHNLKNWMQNMLLWECVAAITSEITFLFEILLSVCGSGTTVTSYEIPRLVILNFSRS